MPFQSLRQKVNWGYAEKGSDMLFEQQKSSLNLTKWGQVSDMLPTIENIANEYCQKKTTNVKLWFPGYSIKWQILGWNEKTKS